MMRLRLVLLLATVALAQAAPKLTMDVTAAGSVNVTLDGTPCLQDVRVPVPAPDWKGAGAVPHRTA